MTVPAECTKIDDFIIQVIQKDKEESDIKAPWVKKKAVKMKKPILLALSVMAILLMGCGGSSYGLLSTAGPGNALITTNTSPPSKGENDRAVCLSISNKSSLSIDVECILDYVQGDAAIDPNYQQRDLLDPWVQLNYTF